MKRPLIWLIRFYQRGDFPLSRPCRKYYPTCSNYGLQAIERFGALKGGLLTLWRIFKVQSLLQGRLRPGARKKRKNEKEKIKSNGRPPSPAALGGKSQVCRFLVGSVTFFGYLLWFFYEFTKNYGVSIILFTIVLKIIMFPFSIKQQKSMAKNTRLQGKQKEIQKKYGDNKQKMSEEMQKLYQQEGVNPMGGCLTSIIPLIIMMGIYYSVVNPLQNTPAHRRKQGHGGDAAAPAGARRGKFVQRLLRRNRSGKAFRLL